jgi:hypothetical protein
VIAVSRSICGGGFFLFRLQRPCAGLVCIWWSSAFHFIVLIGSFLFTLMGGLVLMAHSSVGRPSLLVELMTGLEHGWPLRWDGTAFIVFEHGAYPNELSAWHGMAGSTLNG